MSVPLSTYLPTATFIVLAGYLLQRGWKLSLFSRYTFFYVYVFWEVFRTAFFWTVIPLIGYDTEFYRLYYYGSNAVTPIFHLLVLSDIYFRFRSFDDRSHWYGLAAFIVTVSLLSAQTRPNIYEAYASITMEFRVLFCILIVIQVLRNRQWHIGRNYKGILLGFAIYTVFKSITYFGAMFGVISEQAHFYLRQPTSLLPWFVFAVAMSRLEAPSLRALETAAFRTRPAT